jgi:predicted porin
LALIAVASVTLGATGVNAADLGGNCCADLEERVAELEATTARKGNRKVKLTVSGQVNEAIMFWDDGFEKNQYVVSSNLGRTRFRFVGDAKINADWAAGYLLEIGVRYANSGNRNQNTSRAGGDLGQFDIRHSAWYLDSKTFGRVWLGQTSTATDGITEINLANAITGGSDPSATVGGFFLRRSNGALSTVTWNAVTPSFVGAWNAGEGDRNNVVKYVSPTFVGFTFQAAWGEDDQWDVGLRYAGEFGAFRVAAGIGYRQINDNFGKSSADGPACADLNSTNTAVSAVDCNTLGLSAAVMHVPTGLYVHGSYGRIEDKNRQALFGSAVEDEDTHWYVQAGIEQKFFGFGKTTIFGEYGYYEVGAGLNGVGGINDVRSLVGAAVEVRLQSAETTMWGVGLTQSIDAAAMDLYIGYKNFSVDAQTMNNLNVSTGKASINDHQVVMAGGIIRF